MTNIILLLYVFSKQVLKYFVSNAQTVSQYGSRVTAEQYMAITVSI